MSEDVELKLKKSREIMVLIGGFCCCCCFQDPQRDYKRLKRFCVVELSKKFAINYLFFYDCRPLLLICDWK